MIKKKDERGGMCVMSGKLGCGLYCICLYFAMFTIVERLCVLAVQIVCGEGESKAHKLHYCQ
jgi:membrane-associated PAP2 superfamily phosphatase